MATYECLMPYCWTEVHERRACCDDCWEDRRCLLEALPDLYVMTYAMLTPGSRQQEISTIHLAAIDPAVPINLVAFDSLAYGYQRLAAWAAWCWTMAGRGRLGLAGYNSGRAFHAVTCVLREYDHRIALTSWAGDYALDVWTTYRRLVVQCVNTEPRHLGAPCPDCEAATLVSRHADEYVVCLTCAHTWPHSQLPKLRRQTQRTAS